MIQVVAVVVIGFAAVVIAAVLLYILGMLLTMPIGWSYVALRRAWQGLTHGASHWGAGRPSPLSHA